MFTLTVHDEDIYKRLMAKVEQRGESLDDVLRELLDQGNEPSQLEPPQTIEENQETPAQKLARMIEETDLPFVYPLDARDVEDFLSNETGAQDWRTDKGNDVSA